MLIFVLIILALSLTLSLGSNGNSDYRKASYKEADKADSAGAKIQQAAYPSKGSRP